MSSLIAFLTCVEHFCISTLAILVTKKSEEKVHVIVHA